MQLPAQQPHGKESLPLPPTTSTDPDSEAMPPPQYLPNSQDSQSTTSSTRSLPTSLASLPSNASPPNADSAAEPSYPSSFIQVQSSQPSVLHRTLPQILPYSSNDRATDWRTQQDENGESSPGSDNSASPTHGSKRTASGNVKLSGLASPSTSVKPSVNTGFHSRNTSTLSNANSVGELSAQLKARLMYAMTKVQDSRNKDAIAADGENPSSQLQSPVSASAPGLTMQSPRASLANASRRSRELSQAVGNIPRYTPARPNTSQSAQSLDPSRPAAAPSDLYQQPHLHSNGVPSLAPAPELKPASRDRRVDGFRDGAPPSLIASHHPTTTTPLREPSTPTPQEQDAVDTLLFMSSPANSANFPHRRADAASSLPSPRRSGHFAYPAPLALTDRYDGTYGGDGNAKRRSLRMAVKTEQDVDRILDQMAEMHSSGDDDGDIDLSSHHQNPPVAKRQPAPSKVGVRI